MSKVSIARCDSYDRQKVHGAVKRSVDLLGGMAGFVKPGMKVLIKPNLLSPRPPEDAVDTHPEVVRAVARLVKESGGHVMLGDSPGGYGSNYNEVYAVSGMKQVAEEEGLELVKFVSSKFVDGIPVVKHVLSADCFISVPKFKTHSITVLTLAVKNTFGAVPGLYKAGCHSAAPQEEEFCKVLARIHAAAKPRLNILDGILAMEGDGPSGGTPRRMNFVMASSDPVAMDATVARIVGLNPMDLPIVREAAVLGLGTADLSEIEIAGDSMDNFMVKDFKLPQTTPLELIPKGIAKGIASFIRFKLLVDPNICRKCGLCKVSCPANAITVDDGFFNVNHDKCIRCMCCHEVCPYKAIFIKRNFITKMLWG